MRLLLDTCISPLTRDKLAAAGHDVIWTGDWPKDPGDTAILDAARKDLRVLITLDKDFGELAVIFSQKHAGIIRLVDIAVRHQASACVQTLERYGQDLLRGAMITVEPGRVRVRPHLYDVLEESDL